MIITKITNAYLLLPTLLSYKVWDDPFHSFYVYGDQMDELDALKVNALGYAMRRIGVMICVIVISVC